MQVIEGTMNFFARLFSSGEAFAGFVFFAIVVLTAVVSIVLFFHWRKYGLGSALLALIETVYLSVSAILIAAAFFTMPK